jgi:HEAT repeat protein
MKKILFTILAFTMWGTIAMAQKDQRTLSTKIADLLAQMPAKDSAHLSDGMKEIAAMGANGLSGIAELLSAPGKGDNSKPEYAINGFSYYVTQPGREDWRRMSEKAYCQALAKVIHPVNKAFIISQLQIVGQSDEAVSCLKNYLNDEQLCDNAARALLQINTPAAKDALLVAAQTSNGKARLSLIKALGDSRYNKALPFITSLANSDDKMLTKVALYSLANIGDASSAQLLGNAAQKSNFTFEETNATDSYLLYLSRLVENGNNKLADKLASSLMKNAKQDNQVHTRIAAMTLLAQTQKNKNTKLLLSASSDKNPEYRAAALMIASKNINPATTALWLKKLKKSNPEVQAEIITMLGNAMDESA